MTDRLPQDGPPPLTPAMIQQAMLMKAKMQPPPKRYFMGVVGTNGNLHMVDCNEIVRVEAQPVSEVALVGVDNGSRPPRCTIHLNNGSTFDAEVDGGVSRFFALMNKAYAGGGVEEEPGEGTVEE